MTPKAFVQGVSTKDVLPTQGGQGALAPMPPQIAVLLCNRRVIHTGYLPRPIRRRTLEIQNLRTSGRTRSRKNLDGIAVW